jgi:hypothetical protein
MVILSLSCIWEKQQMEDGQKVDKDATNEGEYLNMIVRQELETAVNSLKKRLDQVKGTAFVPPKKKKRTFER